MANKPGDGVSMTPNRNLMSKAAKRRKRYAPTIFALHAAGYTCGQIADLIKQDKTFVHRVIAGGR